MLLYRILADLVVMVHGAYVAFVIFGQLAVLYGMARKRSWVRNFYFRWLHLLTIAIVVLQSWMGTTCPLTDLENYLRGLAGESGYPGDFVGYWVRELLFYELPSWVFMLSYSIFGAIVLVTFVLAPPRWPSKRPPQAG
ncbi:MAG: DUF2784 domain-containing protein [Pirellulales bacterium]